MGKGKKRSLSDVDDAYLVGVSAFKKEQDSWASLEVKLRESMEKHIPKDCDKGGHPHGSTQLCTPPSSSFQGTGGLGDPLAPSELQPFQRKYICTHGWSERERSTGKRTSHTLRRTECPLPMLAQRTQKSDGSWVLMIMREVY